MWGHLNISHKTTWKKGTGHVKVTIALLWEGIYMIYTPASRNNLNVH